MAQVATEVRVAQAGTGAWVASEEGVAGAREEEGVQAQHNPCWSNGPELPPRFALRKRCPLNQSG